MDATTRGAVLAADKQAVIKEFPLKSVGPRDAPSAIRFAATACPASAESITWRTPTRA